MPLDYLSVKRQIQAQAANAPEELQRIAKLRARAADLLTTNAEKSAELRAKVEQAVTQDSFLRVAKPVSEALNSTHPVPAPPESATLIAADGSQINPSRHDPVNYFLVNVGAIEMQSGSSAAPTTHTRSNLRVFEYSASGSFSEEQIGLERDKSERVLLAELAASAQARPVITLTDGPLELWGGRARDTEEQSHFIDSLDEYLGALTQLQLLGAATAGYVDKPRADLVVRLMEVAATPQESLPDIRKQRPLRGVTDWALFAPLLGPGERSAIFAIQSQLADRYAGPLALHFFYLNVGTAKAAWLARVEIPLWVVEDPALLNALHGALVQQANIMGNLSYPYVLHRAHELAVVTREEREQVTQMLVTELRSKGVDVGQASFKQAAKDLPARSTRRKS
ncbi:MAG: DNA double-strand break repair nuclease NurA [Chloroflexi bacterium]|nr:DNA double-strand break repair nuclease NurA [Chloroflexota bacterium]